MNVSSPSTTPPNLSYVLRWFRFLVLPNSRRNPMHESKLHRLQVPANQKAHPWHKVFHKRMPPEAIDLASRLLQYSLRMCTSIFQYNELVTREPNARLPNERPLPPLFNLKQELAGASPELINRLIPEHVRRQMSGGFPVQAGH